MSGLLDFIPPLDVILFSLGLAVLFVGPMSFFIWANEQDKEKRLKEESAQKAKEARFNRLIKAIEERY